MELNEYQKLANRTKASFNEENKALVIGAMGLAGESGEVIDHIKKVYGHGHKLDVDYLKKELGDILWYIAYMADSLDTTLDEIANINIDKLKRRYPDGFKSSDSINRKD